MLNLLKIEVWRKVAWFHESGFLVQHLAESWHKQHESILPCIGGSVWWWCNGVGIFSCHTLVPLIPTEHHLLIISSIIHLFMEFSHWTETCHLQRFSVAVMWQSTGLWWTPLSCGATKTKKNNCRLLSRPEIQRVKVDVAEDYKYLGVNNDKLDWV